MPNGIVALRLENLGAALRQVRPLVRLLSHLIDELYEAYRNGHTVPLAAFRRYLLTPDDSRTRAVRAHGIMGSP